MSNSQELWPTTTQQKVSCSDLSMACVTTSEHHQGQPWLESNTAGGWGSQHRRTPQEGPSDESPTDVADVCKQPQPQTAPEGCLSGINVRTQTQNPLTSCSPNPQQQKTGMVARIYAHARPASHNKPMGEDEQSDANTCFILTTENNWTKSATWKVNSQSWMWTRDGRVSGCVWWWGQRLSERPAHSELL